MDQGLLVIDQIDAGARFLGEFRKRVPVQAAFWLKESDAGEWNLYVASDQITDDNFDVAYGDVLQVAGSLREPSFDPFQVRLIGMDDPLAKAAMDVQCGLTGRIATRFQGKVFGGLAVEDVYVYPGATPATTR